MKTKLNVTSGAALAIAASLLLGAAAPARANIAGSLGMPNDLSSILVDNVNVPATGDSLGRTSQEADGEDAQDPQAAVYAPLASHTADASDDDTIGPTNVDAHAVDPSHVDSEKDDQENDRDVPQQAVLQPAWSPSSTVGRGGVPRRVARESANADDRGNQVVRNRTAVTTIKRSVALALALVVSGCAQRPAPPNAPSPARAVSLHASDATAAHRERVALVRGVRAYRHHQYLAARTLFTVAVRALPRDAAARYDRARTYEALHQWALAERDLRMAVAARPRWSNARLQLGFVRYRLHSYARSASDCDRVLVGSPKVPGIWLDAGVSYYHGHRWKTAADRFHHAVALAPRSGRARLWLGLAYKKLGKRTFAGRELVLASRSHDRAIRTTAHAALAAR